MPYRQEKIAELIKQKAAWFLSDAASQAVLLTVTQVKLSSDKEYATIYISVLPDNETDQTLAEARKRLRDLKTYLKEQTELRVIPWLSIELDQGEKKRQRLDKLYRAEEEGSE